MHIEFPTLSWNWYTNRIIEYQRLQFVCESAVVFCTDVYIALFQDYCDVHV